MKSPDGAHLNYTADQGLKAVLGDDEQPPEHMTDEQFATYIRECPEGTATSYGDAGRLAAHYMLQWLEAHPSESWRPLSDEIDWQKFKDDGEPMDVLSDPKYVAVEGAYDRIAEEYPAIDEIGLSGFQAGWAWNAARKVLNLGPQANPAIVEIEIGQES